MYNKIAIDAIEIQNDDILRYLGYKGQELSEKMRIDIARCKSAVIEKVKLRFVTASFKLAKMETGINLEKTNLTLSGKDIEELLKDSKECVLMAATIGGEVDTVIKYRQKISISDSVIMDAVATAAIEALCDEIEKQLRKLHPVTYRYSCGYGDLPIELQPKLLSILNTQRTIGLFCNEANIMMPGKSVTAIMGIIEAGSLTRKRNCGSCRYSESCQLKKSGEGCGRFTD